MTGNEPTIRVAIVEDRREIREGLAMIINGTPGFRCSGSYRSMEEALERIGAELPDVVLNDIQLPGMNGIDALKVLRADAATARIPVIAVTASVMQQDRNLITEAGFDGYIGKPINLKEFIDTVRAMVERPK